MGLKRFAFNQWHLAHQSVFSGRSRSRRDAGEGAPGGDAPEGDSPNGSHPDTNDNDQAGTDSDSGDSTSGPEGQDSAQSGGESSGGDPSGAAAEGDQDQSPKATMTRGGAPVGAMTISCPRTPSMFAVRSNE